MPRLSDTQAILLRAAATRPDLSLLPLPGTISLKGAALERTLKALLSRGLVSDGLAPGRRKRASAKNPNRLVISPAGLAALGVDVAGAATDDASDAADAERRADGTVEPDRPGGKLGLLLDAVAGPTGATLDELSTASGWLPHTTRAALTRLRQRGFDVRLEARDGRRAYRLVQAA